VVLTLWADQATRAELDNCEGQLLQVGEAMHSKAMKQQ
jgi:hypothetical protein